MRITLAMPHQLIVNRRGFDAVSMLGFRDSPDQYCLAVSNAQGKKRPVDVISNTVTVMKIATGEIEGPRWKRQESLLENSVAVRRPRCNWTPEGARGRGVSRPAGQV